jgi:sugar phosphate isomerase/epimerase
VPARLARDRLIVRDLSADRALEHLSLNTATVRKQGDFLQILEAAKRHGISCVSPWRDQVQAVGFERAVRAVRDGGFRLSGYCRGGMFPTDAAHSADMRDDNRRAVDEAAALGSPCLVLVVGGLPQFSRPGSRPSKDIAGARAQVEAAIDELLDHADAAGVPLAIEPLHPMYAADRACVNTLRHALDICDRLDPDGARRLGLAIDVYHVWWDPEVYQQIARAGRERIHAFHICEWLVPTRDPLLDRGMMGDGVIEIPKLRAAVEAQGFTGPCEVEIFSEYWWSRPMEEVLSTMVARYRADC